MAAHVTIVTLGVSDLAASTSFYESLGFEKSSGSEDTITFLFAGALVLALYGRVPLAEDAGVPADGSGFRGVSLAMNLRSAEEVDTEFARWTSLGAAPVKQPQAAEWGGYSSYVADPDGHLWEIAHNPYMALHEDGSAKRPE